MTLKQALKKEINATSNGCIFFFLFSYSMCSDQDQRKGSVFSCQLCWLFDCSWLRDLSKQNFVRIICRADSQLVMSCQVMMVQTTYTAAMQYKFWRQLFFFFLWSKTEKMLTKKMEIVITGQHQSFHIFEASCDRLFL